MQPIIGLTMSFNSEGYSYFVRPNYISLVKSVGGTPILLPPVLEAEEVKKLTEICDGILLTGGDDVEPYRYGEERMECCGNTTPQRDEMEQALIRAAVERDMPVFGICRGIQILNVSLGGTLYQDLATQIKPECARHQQPAPYYNPTHNVNIVPDSPLHELWHTASAQVNSMHHQAIKQLAPCLEVMAYAPEGFVEAVYAPAHRFVRAVQWHPEHLCMPGGDDILRQRQMSMLREFVDAAAAEHARRR